MVRYVVNEVVKTNTSLSSEFAAFFAAIGLVVLLLFLWLSSRGKFIFLDDVVSGQARIVEPWNRFKRLGDSLFLWRAAFVLACSLLAGSLGATTFIILGPLRQFDLDVLIGIAGHRFLPILCVHLRTSLAQHLGESNWASQPRTFRAENVYSLRAQNF